MLSSALPVGVFLGDDNACTEAVLVQVIFASQDRLILDPSGLGYSHKFRTGVCREGS